ncbi:hypothetical protein PF005_g31890 [Phytophthora fragariae]|uniref:Uncharacterized protein n=1 Tax=Phytophthora fragariae TaxID=53985 RepID=A0A6A3PIC3_9STRA|nr:hypothetical protein PF011_g30572 [Phytophthora fragariae]KAE9057850.1 hypothetical protein PF007_g31506 [Phytophthora fragariae]KAE9159855.1 hypothetical protein PF005_g31890 [Phytophthora fragariae]
MLWITVHMYSLFLLTNFANLWIDSAHLWIFPVASSPAASGDSQTTWGLNWSVSTTLG